AALVSAPAGSTTPSSLATPSVVAPHKSLLSGGASDDGGGAFGRRPGSNSVETYISLSYLFRISKSAISGIVDEVCQAIAIGLKDYLKIMCLTEKMVMLKLYPVVGESRDFQIIICYPFPNRDLIITVLLRRKFEMSLEIILIHQTEKFLGSTNKESPKPNELLSIEEVGINRAGPSTDTDDDEVKKARIDLCSAPSAAAARTGYDIGKYVCHPPSNDEEKLRALKEPWIPPDTFKFPVTDTGKKKLSFQRHWTNRYSWLVYSNLMQGALCKVCVLLGKTQGGRGHQELGAFVSKPFINWKKALESFDHHADTKYHKFAVEQAANFARIMEGKTLDVTECLNVENNKIAEENRKRLKAIVETIILCGRQAIALRGSHDSGEIGINEPEHNDGNFRALLRFRARSGDEALKNHLLTQNIHSRAMYTSSVIQNEVIELCGSAIQTQVLNRVKEAGFFTILADETQDISRGEQLALCLRYVHCSSGKSVILEDFLEFIHVEDVSAQALATTIISHLLSYNLDMDKWIGQGYDGAAVMSGRLRGVRTIISEQYPKAQFVHCVAHVLNLVLAHSCGIPMIRNCIGTIKSVINFFRQSPLRDGLLKKIADQINSSHSTLISLCETRWTEKHVAVERFAEMVPVIRETLGALQDAASSDVATQAYHLQTAVDNSQFIVSLVILRKVFSYTANLNKAMQKVNVDLTNICEYTKTVKTTLLNVRNESQFAILFEQAQQMSSGDIVVPRITRRQTLRNNIAAETAEIYYRRNVFYPFIDHVIAELDARFKPHESTIEGIQMLLPEKTSNDSRIKENLEKIAQTFLGGENEGTIFLSEYEIWHNHWKSVAQKPATVLDAIDNCDDQFFPSIKKLLIILATLPVSTATPERSFSTLKRLKAYLRNKMGDERLTGLALMSVHRDLAVQLDSEEIINQLKMPRSKPKFLPKNIRNKWKNEDMVGAMECVNINKPWVPSVWRKAVITLKRGGRCHKPCIDLTNFLTLKMKEAFTNAAMKPEN
ncbi:unnamed protein product, partial [Acanthoscelides obtectus]